MRLGIVGLGRMGAAMSRRLRQQGFDVTGWDQSAKANEELAADGLRIAADARGVAAVSEIVISSITEDHGVRKIFTGPAGFLEGDVKGKLFIEMSTLQPMTGRELLPLVEARGARLIEAPVLGKLTRRIVHMGGNGSGYAMKLAANLGLGAYIQAVAESLALGLQQGLALDLMVDVLQESATACGWLKSKAAVLKGNSGDMTLDIRTLRKDIMSAVATGALTGVPMPLAAGTLASLSAAVDGDYGDGDLAELPKFFREAMLQKFDR